MNQHTPNTPGNTHPRRLNRRVVVGGIVALGGVAAIAGASTMSSPDYAAMVAEQLRPLGLDSSRMELVRIATLAASSHNTQPWHFRIAEDSISVLPDYSRRTPVVDPDDHHLFASLGCAAENLSIAARAGSRGGEIALSEAGDGPGILVSLRSGPSEDQNFLAAIPMRQCSRTEYDASAPEGEVIDRLEAAATLDSVEPIFVFDTARREHLIQLVVEGNGLQLDDPAFRSELKAWLRFNEAAAASTRDGLYSAASGNPSLPNWLGPFMYDLTVNKDGDNAKVERQLRSSSGIVVFAAPTDDWRGWVAAGRAYQRFALQATLDGFKHAFVNQVVEVPSLRSQLQSLLGLGDRRASLVVRFGKGPEMPRSLRRPVSHVVISNEG